MESALVEKRAKVCKQNIMISSNEIVKKYPNLFNSNKQVLYALKHESVTDDERIIRKKLFGRDTSLTKEETLHFLQMYISEKGYVSTSRECLNDLHKVYLYSIEYFGSWRNALGNIGVDSQLTVWEHSRKPIKEQRRVLLELIDNFYKDNDRYPSYKEIEDRISCDWPARTKYYSLITKEERKYFTNINRQKCKERKISGVKEEILNNPSITNDTCVKKLGVQGKDVKNVREELGVANNYIKTMELREMLYSAASKNFPEVEYGSRGREIAERVYNGETLTAISEEKNISKERTRQLLNKYLKIVACEEQIKGEISYKDAIKIILDAYKIYGNIVLKFGGYNKLLSKEKIVFPKYLSFRLLIKELGDKHLGEIAFEDWHWVCSNLPEEYFIELLFNIVKKYGESNLNSEVYKKTSMEHPEEVPPIHRILIVHRSWKVLRDKVKQRISK